MSDELLQSLMRRAGKSHWSISKLLNETLGVRPYDADLIAGRALKAAEQAK